MRADYKITENMNREKSCEDVYVEVLDMLKDRLNDAEIDLIKAQAKTEVIRSMVGEIEMILKHMIIG